MAPPSTEVSHAGPAVVATGGVVLFDGQCGLCDRFVSFVIARDHGRRFQYAALQGGWAQRALQARGYAAAVGAGEDGGFTTVIVLTSGGRLLERSAAVFYVLAALGGAWRALALLRFLPGFLTNWAYDQVARRRLRFFGRHATCRLPKPEERALFLGD